VRSKPRVINSVTGTKDLQHVNISLRVLSRPVENKLPEIFSKIGIDFDERVLPGVGNEVLKAVVVRTHTYLMPARLRRLLLFHFFSGGQGTARNADP